MSEEQLQAKMTFRKGGQKIRPLFVAQINDRFILAVYQGVISELDILIKYRQKTKARWSRIRTPKHIHWAVDLLIKMHAEREQTKRFLNFLIGIWNETIPIRSEKEKQESLTIENLLGSCAAEIAEYQELEKRGEYSIRFLILLAKLLMLQEKTNRPDAYMFKKLLDALLEGEDIFKIVSTASMGKRNR